jgi:hypothetical protein
MATLALTFFICKDPRITKVRELADVLIIDSSLVTRAAYDVLDMLDSSDQCPKGIGWQSDYVITRP